MPTTAFVDLLLAARRQSEPQHLYLIFTAAELPQDASAEQRSRFAERQGGALTPVMAVDKSPEDLVDFGALVDESAQTGQHWDMVFVTTQSVVSKLPPDPQRVEQTLTGLIERIRAGQIDCFATFDRQGRLVHLR